VGGRPRACLASQDVPDALFDLPAAAGSPPRPQRLTSKGIAAGDVVEIDKKGRRFHALVKALEQDAKGYFHLELQPFDRRVSYRQATVREVVTVWRRVRTGPAAAPGA
jgi:hypothetical protein